MKKTLMFTALVTAMSLPLAAGAADNLVNGNSGSTVSGVGAYSKGALSPATNKPTASYNPVNDRSQNLNMSEAFNEINSDNKVDIAKDGNVLYANRADQAVAAADMDATVSGNTVLVNSAYSKAALSPATNKPTSESFSTSNKITASFSGAAGIAMVSQNTGHASSIQQGTLVQSNFKLQ